MSKNNKSAQSNEPEVDMDKIKKMMGPLPDEPQQEGAEKPKIIERDESLAEAAEEANQVLKAMDPELDANQIKKVEEEPVAEDNLPVSDNEETDDEQDLAEPLDDPKLEEAVDEIVAEEGDTVLKTEDEKLEQQKKLLEPKRKSIKQLLNSLWSKKSVRYGLIIAIFLGVVTIAVVPASRYFVLNTAGARGGLEVKILDGSNLLPLKNVTVSIGSNSVVTNDAGVAKLQHLKLGKSSLVINKRAFEVVNKTVTIGWGSNPQGDVSLKATGSQYVILVNDFLSGKPIEGVKASSDDANAQSDKNGKIILTVDTSNKKDNEKISVEIKSDQYRTESVDINADTVVETKLNLVPSRKHVFVSKRSGTYDIYSIDTDGKNEKKLISGTGVERQDIALLPDRSGQYVAYVSTRENVRNSDGYLLSTLYLLDVSEGSLTKIDQSEQFQLVGWSKEARLAYVKIVAGTSAANPNRTKILSVNSNKISDKKELASANYFNDVAMFADKVYYTPGNESQTNPKPGLYSIQIDGTAKITILDKLAWNLYRTSYDTVAINSAGTWYTHKIGSSAASTTGASATSINRLYTDSPDQKHSVWTDQRDGKGVLLSYDLSTAKDTQVVSKSGLKAPLYWINNNTVVFRLNDGKELADYVVNIDGGDAKKIANVTDTSGADRWFYY